MSSEWSQAFYWSPEWRNCRKGFISYKGGLCEKCLAKGLIVPGNHVHHKVFLTPENINDASVSLNWNNLELLCEKCHEEIHDSHHSKSRMIIGKDGKVIARQVDTR